MKAFTLLLILFMTYLNLPAQEKRAMTIDDLWNMKRIGKAVLSPDGSTLAFAVTTYNMNDNKGNTDIWLVNTDGTGLRPFRNSDKNESDPAFSPDGKYISYVSDGQIKAGSWSSSADTKKKPAKSRDIQLTSIYTGASGAVWSKDASKLLFVSSVYPDCADQDCNKKRDEEKANSKVKASIFTELMYRHWDSWRGEKRSHLFITDVNTKAKAAKEYTDLIRGSKNDVPPIALGSDDDYSFSPDSNEIAFVMNEDDTTAISTNNDVFIINLKDINKNGKTPYKKISLSRGNDYHPVYSPDGRYIAYLSMERAGFEADKHRIMLYDRNTGQTKDLTERFDRSADKLVWSHDSKYLYFNAPNEINNSLYRLDLSTNIIKMILPKRVNEIVGISPDGSKIYFKQQRSDQPFELFSMSSSGGNVKQLTSLNKDVLDKIEMQPAEAFWFEGANRTNVQAIMVKPPFFNINKKYPMIFLIHGGPQGAFTDDFHYRWNLQMFASRGYVVVAVNPRGSIGYGQKFTDEITLDWAGKPYIDLMNCYDYAVKNYEFIDKNNTFAAGASYGGYMINWIEGHTDRFNALVCHDGVFNMESMYGSTEELWFPEWEYGGAPWQNRDFYRKNSPHQYVDNFKTPMLVVHGGLDFRVPESQAFELFTSLQRKGVESRFLYYPDETHFVAKPQNSRLWWESIFEWFGKHRR